MALITGTPANVAEGSGTFVAAMNLRAGLEALGHTVELVVPPPGTPATPYSRFRFNASLHPSRLRSYDLLCGFDLDGWLAAPRAGAPYVAWLHGVIADEARFERGVTRLSLWLQSLAERSAAARADLVLAPSEYSAARLSVLYGIDRPRIRVVPPGFDIARWQQAMDTVPAVGSSRLTVLCTGRMYPRKNHAALLRAVAALAPRFPDFFLRIVGDGPERDRLFAQAQQLRITDRVAFRGVISYQDLVAEYARCDVFCLPTLQEGFGIVFAEAMASGKPIVACAAGAVPEMVRDGENGYLAPPGDDRALAEALAKLLADPALRLRIGRANRAEALRRFGVERAAGKFLQAIRPLVSGGAAPAAKV